MISTVPRYSTYRFRKTEDDFSLQNPEGLMKSTLYSDKVCMGLFPCLHIIVFDPSCNKDLLAYDALLCLTRWAPQACREGK
jgi:hypothetical protein